MSTLYGNENVLPWNPETDQYEALKLAEEEAAITQAVEEGRGLELLTQSAGFQTLQNYLLASIEDLKAKLTSEQDFRKIRRLQEAVKAYQNVLLFVDYKINEGRALSQKRGPQG